MRAHGELKVCSHAHTASSLDIACTEPAAQLLADHLAERVSSLIQLQALSAQLAAFTGGSGLEAFSLPPGVTWPVVARPGQLRKLKEGVAYLAWRDPCTGGIRSRAELPLDLEALDWPLLVVHRDEGSVGTAGFAFATTPEGMNKLIIDFSDSFHRGPNDVKLAT